MDQHRCKPGRQSSRKSMEAEAEQVAIEEQLREKVSSKGVPF